MTSGIPTEATTTSPSSPRSSHVASSRLLPTATTPTTNASPMIVAEAECSRSSTSSPGTPGSQGRCENAAVASIITPKPPSAAVAHRPQRGRHAEANHSTASPNSRNPDRATHAPSSPCAADSLIECRTHE